MKALTIWQPWASLILAGAKPYEFRSWDYSKRYPKLVGQRIAIHAGARPIKASEIKDLCERIDTGHTALIPEIAKPVIDAVGLSLSQGGGWIYSAVLCTAVLGKPRKASGLFGFTAADSDRIDHQLYAWPLTDIRPVLPPAERRGAQGFWNCNLPEGA